MEPVQSTANTRSSVSTEEQGGVAGPSVRLASGTALALISRVSWLDGDASFTAMMMRACCLW